MTTTQLKDLNTYLKSATDPSNELFRKQLILFFYQIKSNWDNYRIGKSICKVNITWDGYDPKLDTIIGLKANNQLRPVLAALFYNYLISVNPTTGIWKQIKEAIVIQKNYKNNAIRYFKEGCQCKPDIITKENYSQYIIKYKENNYHLNYFYNQPQRYYGNR